ncbi:MgtC/SapB family protein [Arthrobacter sp. Helios]|uniref:MgtC/SapB family protein n=1 Tax=Arthrobacter sp. Helios TaxID=2828862 RepID=UPI00205A4B5D|nr:MgtC/SapB family protein [Arthrobacter sp. Helios]UPO76162.1 MgtC/SapB family protein [Arthrobacter sp. Helios]
MEFFTDTFLTEVVLASCAFGLSCLIGLERQIRQKSAGLRTHALVGTGSAIFTLVSAFGFSTVLGDDVTLDPSRIAAQIVSGIGFLGAGVIFVNRDVVRGLTTAATVWMSAAIGMACGAGMVPLAIVATMLHFVAVGVLAPLTRLLPTPDGKRTVRIRYQDGRGVLRDILATATGMGFDSSILDTRQIGADDDEAAQVAVEMRFRGKPPLRELLTQLSELPGVRRISLRDDVDEDSVLEDDDAAGPRRRLLRTRR